MAREDATKTGADKTATMPEGRYIAPESSANNLIHPPSIQVPIPPHRAGSQWSPLPSGPPAYFSRFQSLQYRTLFASPPDEVALEQTVSQPSATSSNYQFTPKGGVHASSGLVLPNPSKPLRSQSDANAVITAPLSRYTSTYQHLSQRTVRPAELHSSASASDATGPMRSVGVNQRFTNQPLSQSSQRRRGPVPGSPAVTKPSEILKTIASHRVGGPNLLQPILSLDKATRISAMPSVAGKKRTRDDKEALEDSSDSPRTTKALKRPSHEGQVSRKKICLLEDRQNKDSGEIQYLGTNQALTLSRPIPPPSLVRSASGISLASHSTVYAPSPETCPPSSHQSFAPTPACSSESSPSAGQDVTARGSSKQPPMPCPSPSLQYIWDAIENPVVPVLPPNWDVKAFEEAMERPVKAENISFERAFYPFYAAKYDPEGLAKGTFGRRSQAELEDWFSRVRRWESENPEVVAAETRAQNEELRRLFGS